METKLDICLSVFIPDTGVSFNKLLNEVSNALNALGPLIISEIVEECQKKLIEDICGEKAPLHLVNHTRKNEPEQYCLRTDPFIKKGFRKKPRSISTELGEVSFRLHLLQCQSCGHREAPILKFLKLDQYQSHSDSLEKILMEVIAKETYRDGVARINGIAGVPIPKSTAHRWVIESTATSFASPSAEIKSLMADSTKVKMEGGRKDSIRAVVGLDAVGKMHPLGTWMTKDWSEIEECLAKQLSQQQRKPELVVSDAEPGLDEHLAPLANRVQRCQWHLLRDLRVIMWKDGLRKAAVDPYQRQIQGLIGIEIPKEDYQVIKPSDKKALEKRVNKAKEGFHELIDEFANRGYHNAKTYLENALSKVFTHVELWLKIGYLAPKTTSILENVMRALGKRLKKFAYNWSDFGAEQVARIILKRLPDEEQWREYWHRILNLSDECSINIEYCRVAA